MSRHEEWRHEALSTPRKCLCLWIQTFIEQTLWNVWANITTHVVGIDRADFELLTHQQIFKLISLELIAIQTHLNELSDETIQLFVLEAWKKA